MQRADARGRTHLGYTVIAAIRPGIELCLSPNVEKGSRHMDIRAQVRFLHGALLAATLVFPLAHAADTPAQTVLCKDGTTSTHTGRGACSHHGGVDKSGGAQTAGSSAGAATSATPAAPPSPSAPPAASAPPATTPAAPAAPAQRNTTPTPRSSTGGASGAVAPGGGPGLVWVNSNSKVYHCPGDRWYGKTKQGEYMTESQAKAQGNRPDHNKPCP
jgi:hypothetical protein